MIDWLLDTLIWTAALIAMVILVRRPVARWFGPQAAYALWALPILRLVLPPLTLPAWMALARPAANDPAVEPTALLLIDPELVAASEPAPSMIPFSLVELALAAWLAGVIVFLYLRFRSYQQMREDMLRHGREVGRVGKVRLIETPATGSPLAFGVIDKVVALPQGFLAAWDRGARDLALAHELAHHKGHDLLINMAAQPLFALHWFNPLGHLGWLALRRDQEAACDARVIANRSIEERVTYAKVIASFAAGPNVALAAPMACPVLGEKSIIHRLRSIKMNNHSNRQRWLGRGLLATALIAMPMTATISYAESSPLAPEPPEAPQAPDAPEPPTPPAPPAPPSVSEASEDGTRVWREVEEEVGDDGEIRRVEKVFVLRHGEKPNEEELKKFREGSEEARKARADVHVALVEARKEVDAAMKEAEKEMKQARIEMRIAMDEAKGAKVFKLHNNDDVAEIDLSCTDGKAGTSVDANGKKVAKICVTQIAASALKGLEAARAAISANKEMHDEMRKEVLKELDREISRLKQSRI